MNKLKIFLILVFIFKKACDLTTSTTVLNITNDILMETFFLNATISFSRQGGSEESHAKSEIWAKIFLCTPVYRQEREK